MKFSIVIPTLNEEKYVSGILNSLVNQTLTDFEVLVVDADSKDKTKEVVSGFEDKLNITFIASPKKGVSFQRNYGAQKATSKNVIFFDADTLIEPVFLQKVYIFIENNPVDVLTCWNIPISMKKRDKMFFWAFNHIYMEGLKKVNPVAVGTFIYAKKKAFIEAGMFSEEVIIGEDFELVQRMHKKKYKYVLLRDPVVYFSIRRYEQVGRFKYALATLKAGVYYYFKGPIKEAIIDYDMEGNIR